MSYVLAHQERVQAQITQVESAIAQTEVSVYVLDIFKNLNTSQLTEMFWIGIKISQNAQNIVYIELIFTWV